MKRFLGILCLLVSCLLVVSCDDDNDNKKPQQEENDNQGNNNQGNNNQGNNNQGNNNQGNNNQQTNSSVSFCNVKWAEPNVKTGEYFKAYSLVEASGITGASGSHQGLKAQSGWVEADTSKTLADVHWSDAQYNSSYDNAEAGKDEFMSTDVKAESAGLFVVYYRYSLDNGATWTYCDKDGVASSVDISKITLVTVSDNGGSNQGDGNDKDSCDKTFNYFNKDTSVGAGGAADFSVNLVGSFNDWDLNDDNYRMTADGQGNHSITIKLAPGTYKYKFHVNGWVNEQENRDDGWKNDPNNNDLDAEGNNVFTHTCGGSQPGGNDKPAGGNVEWCSVTTPGLPFSDATHKFPAGTTLDNLRGQVYVPGVTGPNGTHSGIQAKVGWVESDFSKTINDVTWTTAHYDKSVGDNDEYVIDNGFKLDNGWYVIFFAFSTDGGQNWTGCDGDGVFTQLDTMKIVSVGVGM